jgi:hypothetical protein
MKAAPASIDRHLLMMGLAAVVLAGVGQVRVALAAEGAEGKVVFADDFETPSAQSPLANWATNRTRCPPTTRATPRNGMGAKRVSGSITRREREGMLCPRPTVRFSPNKG